MKHKLSKLSPLLFTLFAFILLSFVTYKQFSIPRPTYMLILQILVIACYVAYMAFESKISIREINKTESDDFDKNTMELAAIIKISLLFSCLGLGNTIVEKDRFLLFGIFGLITMIGGFYIRGSSIVKLGHHYGHRIRPLGSYLEEEGTYSVIRHGAYSGTFFIHMGVTILFLNYLSLFLIFCWLGVVILRIELEEKLLMKDERYKAYSKKTKYKMIPYIW